MDRKSVAALVALGFVLGGSSAKAESMYTVDIAGTVASGTIYNHQFQAIGTFNELNGRSFTDIAYYNEYTRIFNQSFEIDLSGSVLSGSSLIFNGYGDIQASKDVDGDLTYLDVFGNGQEIPGAFTYTTLQFYTFQGDVNGLAEFNISSDSFVDLKLNVASLGVDIAPAPLPASLPMFGAAILAFGCVGWVRRRMHIRLGSMITKRRSPEPNPV